ITRESGLRQNGQCITSPAYPVVAARLLETSRDRLAVSRERLRLSEGDDTVGDARQRVVVVLDNLLRTQERVCAEAGRIARLAAGRQHVVTSGHIVAEAHGSRGTDEQCTGVRVVVCGGTRVDEVKLEVLGAVGVAE